MGKSLLVKVFGFPATLIHGDTLVLDRWMWLRKHLRRVKSGERLLDVGCGTGAFSIGSTRYGYQVLGLSWDERNQSVARQRAEICKASASFDVLDVRQLHTRTDLIGQFDVVICLETIEHILDDAALATRISACLKPGGRVLLTTPNLEFRPMGVEDDGPCSTVEDGGHVRRGYSPEMLRTLCQTAGLVPDEISYCSGYLSQKITGIMRIFERIHPLLGWVFVLPLRPIPLVLDGIATKIMRWPGYSICLEAHKPH